MTPAHNREHLSPHEEDTMTDDDLAALIEAAEAATPGPWFACPTVDGIAANENCRVRTETYGHGYVADTSNFHGRPFDVKRRRENAAFIAAANPSVIIALATEVRSARKALAAVREFRRLLSAYAYSNHRDTVKAIDAALALANPEVPTEYAVGSPGSAIPMPASHKKCPEGGVDPRSTNPEVKSEN